MNTKSNAIRGTIAALAAAIPGTARLNAEDDPAALRDRIGHRGRPMAEVAEAAKQEFDAKR